MHAIRHVTLWLAMAVLAGCSSITPYPDTLPENMRVQTMIDSGSMMTSVIADFDISRVNAQCQTDYQGRVHLDKPEVRVGLAADQPLYLGFVFTSKGFLSSSTSSVFYDTLLIPRTGYEYVAQVRYVRSVYDVVIRETRPGSTVSRVVERRPLSACGKK